MYRPCGEDSPPNVREPSSLPPENLTWYREPCNRDLRTDKMDRDRVGAGKRHWIGDQSLSMTSFQGVTSGAALSGNHFVPRSKPRFQGHYSGFFAESGRNGRSLSATGPVDTGLVRRFHRNPYPSGTSAAKSRGFSVSAGVDYLSSDTEGRHNRDQFLLSGDDKGRDQPLPPHTPHVHSDSPSTKKEERTRPLGSKNWEYPPRIDRAILTRPYECADLYDSRRRSIVTQFDGGRDWGVGDKRCEIGRFERYGNGSRDGPYADHEGSNKDTGFSHGWSRERGNSGVVARRSGFRAASRNSGDLRCRGSLPVGSVHDPLHATALSLNQDFEQPSPSKRPRLGWGQGLAKYEKKVDVSPSVVNEKNGDVSPNVEKEGEDDTSLTVGEIEEKRGVDHEKLFVLGWEHKYKRQHGDSFIVDAHERRGENEMIILIREHGVREVSDQNASSCVLLRDSVRMSEEDERRLVLAQALQGLEGRPSSPVEIEGAENNMRGGRDENRGAVSNDSGEPDLDRQSLAPPTLAEDNESRRRDNEVTFGMLEERESLNGKDRSLKPSFPVEEPERILWEDEKDFVHLEKFEDFLVGRYQNSLLIKPLNNVKRDLTISDTLSKAETRALGISSSSTFVTDSDIGERGTNAMVSFSRTSHLELNAEDSYVVCSMQASPEMSSSGCEKHNSPRSRVLDVFLTAPAPALLAESVGLPESSPNHISTSALPSNHQCDEQDVIEISVDERPLTEAQVLEEPAKITLTVIGIAPKETLENAEFKPVPEASHWLLQKEKTDSGDSKPVSAVLQTEPAIALDAANLDISTSEAREQVFVTNNSDETPLKLEPASEGYLVTVISTVYDVDYRLPVDSASQTEKSIIETVERVEAEIVLVKKEIAQNFELSSELNADVRLETSGTHDAALDSPLKNAEDKDVSILMEEGTTDTGVVYHYSHSSPTAVPIRLEKSPICSKRDIFRSPDLLVREMSIPEKEVLELVPRGVQWKSTSLDKGSDDKDVRGVRPAGLSLSLGPEELDYFENQFCNEVVLGGSPVQERDQTMIELFVMENKKIARLSGAPFVHLLPKHLTGTVDEQVYHSPIEAPVCQRNVEMHKNIHERLLEKIAERRHFIRFKERVLALRYRSLKEAWKRKQKGLFDRRNHPKTVRSERRSGHGPPSQRSSLRLRPLGLDRPEAESDAAQAMKTLMKHPQVGALRPVLKMPAMILDEKERAVRRFVSRNALVEDPIAVEMERKTFNPWTADERKTFAEKFAVYNKNFKVIASYLQYKTTADCVEFYYRNKKSEEFGKPQHGLQLKNRWDYTKTNSTFLTPTTAGIIRNHEVNCARIEALNAANTNIKLFQRKSQLHVFEDANPPIDPFIMPSNIEMLEVMLPSGATMEAAMSSLISTPCSVSSTAAPLTDQRKEENSRKERIRSWASTARSSHSEQHPTGLRGTRSTYLRRISSRAAGQEDSEWTDAERELFTSAVAAYGKNFRIIASYVSTKSQSQCKSFFSKTRKRLCLDELVEKFQANEAAAMLVQSFRHDADLAQEVKLISIPEIDASDGITGEELIDTAAAVSTLESLKGQSNFLANNVSDLSLVADAAAVMDEITLVKPETPTINLFSSGKSMTTSQDLACELLEVNRSNFTISSTLLREEEDEDSEATKSDGTYQVGTEVETDIVVDQAAAALIGMSAMLADKSELKRSMSEAKGGTKLSPVSVFSRSQSARLPIICPPYHAVTEANLYLTSGRSARHAKERVNAIISCKATTRDRLQDMHDVHIGRKGRETAGGEPKPRREPTSWTQEEKEKFAVILQEHGKDWALLHESFPSKSLTQIKTYFQNSKARSRLPASDKLSTVVRNDGANRKRKVDEFESTRRAAEVALPVKQNVRGNAAPPEVYCATQKVDTLVGSTLVSGTTGVGVDILAYPARLGTFSGQPVDQDSLSMNEMQHLVRQMVPTNTYGQGISQDGHQGFRPGVRPALPSSVVTRPHSLDGIPHLLSGSGPSKPICSDLRALSPGVVPQADPPAAIRQVAQQVQQMLQQQQHLQKQLNLLIQQQAALPPQLLPQHKQAAQQTLQAVQPLEEKLYQVVQQLQQQYELEGRGQAPTEDEESISRMDHFQHHHITPTRGILKVKPIRGALPKPLVDLATLSSSGVLPNQAKSKNEGIQLHQQGYSLSLGIGTLPTVTAGITAGVQVNHAKTVELQDSDTDTDCEGSGRRLIVTGDSHQRMSIVYSTSSGQQQNTTQSTTSTLSSDSEQVKSWDVKLFGQSLLSKPPSLPSSVLRSVGSSIQELLNLNPSASVPTMAFSTATLLKGFRTSESLPSAFGRVGASSIISEGQQQPTSWSGQYGAWNTTSSFQLSGVNELTRREPDSERAQEAITSLAAQSDTEVLVLAPKQFSQGDAEHLDSGSGNVCTVQFETDAAIEGSPFIDRSQSSLNGGQVA